MRVAQILRANRTNRTTVRQTRLYSNDRMRHVIRKKIVEPKVIRLPPIYTLIRDEL